MLGLRENICFFRRVLYNEKTYNLEITDIEQPYITSPDQAVTDQRIRFSAEETNLPGWTIDRYYWNFGDETIAIGKEVDKVYHTIVNILVKKMKNIYKDAFWFAVNDKVIKRYS